MIATSGIELLSVYQAALCRGDRLQHSVKLLRNADPSLPDDHASATQSYLRAKEMKRSGSGHRGEFSTSGTSGMVERVFGHVPGYPEGSLFENRAELHAAGVHRHLQAGISGSQTEGAESIVLSGGYEDDQDFGDLIIYTGFGGRDTVTGRQTHDQPFTGWNRALAYSSQNGLPVRVIRGSKHDSPYSPLTGYSYDGLYAVDRFWRETGKSGFKIWRFRLVKIPDKVVPGQLVAEEPDRYSAAERQEVRVSRIVRDTTQARRVKALHDYRCQMCGTRLECPAEPYAEAAHIRPLGTPHHGPDTADNILCLCPNHHVLFDNGAVSVAKDLSLIGDSGSFSIHRDHRLNEAHLAYHREHILVASRDKPRSS